jgi:hypothetical protein
MNSLPGRILGGLAVCAGFYWLTHDLLGPLVWLFVAMLAGPVFTRVLIDLAAELGWRVRIQQLDALSGTHYRFQTFTVHVVEDDDHCRWIATDEIRKIVGSLVNDRILAQSFPSGHQYLGKDQRGYLRDDALMAHLIHINTPQAIKFKNWVERDVAFSARKIRQRKGIVIADATALPRD